MKKKIIKFLTLSLCGALLFNVCTTNTYAMELVDENIEIEKELEETQEDANVLTDEMFEDKTQETLDVDAELQEGEDIATPATQEEFKIDKTTNSENTGLFIDGKEYKGNVLIDIKVSSDGKTALTSGTTFEITFESLHNDFSKSVTITNKSLLKGISIEIPVDEYMILTSSSLNGRASSANLELMTDDSTTVIILEDGQKINFTLHGDVSTTEQTVTEPDEPEKKETNFWLDLLKNNIIYLILLLGCGIALLVFRLKRDNQ